ncbi:unnamed protein product, partial [Amoebophrya sp. A25]
GSGGAKGKYVRPKFSATAGRGATGSRFCSVDDKGKTQQPVSGTATSSNLTMPRKAPLPKTS